MSLLAGREALDTLQGLWRHPRGRREALVAFQDRKLAALIAHAYAHVAHYRELLDGAGLRPDDIRSVADLRHVPVTTKDDLRRRPLADTLRAGADPARLVALLTSGSSGQPFTVRRAAWEEHLTNMFRLRACYQVGLRPFDRVAKLRETPLGGRTRGLPGRVRQALGIHRDVDVDCYQPVADIARALRRLRPDVLEGYPSALAQVATAGAGEPRTPGQPRLLIAGGEVLTAPVRQVIERGFGTRVFDFYGAHEFNLLAWECPQGGIQHVCDDNVVVEILGADGPVSEGATGEVVATALHSRTMPFIRYRTGDLATRGPRTCPCGQPFSTLRAVQGRVVEYFRLPGGRDVHPFVITGPLIERHGAWILQHQMIQQSPHAVTLRILPARPPRPDDLAWLSALARQQLGPEVGFTVEIVERFVSPPGQKFSPYLGLPPASFR
jgi:phenylacetate-CoA ligase